MKDRIKKLRKSLDMTQQEFADRIGVKRNTIGQYEIGRNEPIDTVINLICREFNVSEEWLRNGSGEMFNPAPTDILDHLAQKYKLSNAAYIIIEKFVNLPPEKQTELIDFCMEVSKAIIESDSAPNAPAFPEIHDHQTISKVSTEDNGGSPIEREFEQMTVEELEEEYKKSVLNHVQKAKADSCAALNTTGEDMKKKNA